MNLITSYPHLGNVMYCIKVRYGLIHEHALLVILS